MTCIKIKLDDNLLIDTVASIRSDLIYVIEFRDEIYAVHSSLEEAKYDCELLCIVRNPGEEIKLTVKKLGV